MLKLFILYKYLHVQKKDFANQDILVEHQQFLCELSSKAFMTHQGMHIHKTMHSDYPKYLFMQCKAIFWTKDIFTGVICSHIHKFCVEVRKIKCLEFDAEFCNTRYCLGIYHTACLQWDKALDKALLRALKSMLNIISVFKCQNLKYLFYYLLFRVLFSHCKAYIRK